MDGIRHVVISIALPRVAVRDASGGFARATEMVSHTEEAGIVHLVLGEDGRPSMGYSEDSDEVCMWDMQRGGALHMRRPQQRSPVVAGATHSVIIVFPDKCMIIVYRDFVLPDACQA